jgi:hypothetical protein
MHMAAVVEMTVIDIEFADQLILGGVGNAYAEVFRHTGMGGGRGHSRAPIRGKNSRRSYSNVNRRGVVDMSLTAALMRHVVGFGPVPHQLSHFLTDAFLTIEMGSLIPAPWKGRAQRGFRRCLRPVAAVERPGRKASQKYLKFPDQPIWLSLSVG